ncbi:MAG: family 16 glycosylhydrolase [Bacteroidota bacterium]
MKYLISSVAAFSCFFIFTSCAKADGGKNQIPANLLITSDISTDGSGAVGFTASADNAVTYDYEFGNGEVQAGTSGIITYKYIIGGTNNYDVTVTAISSSGLSIKKTVQITVVVSGEQGLFWSDEFNTDGAPDPAKWGYDIGTGSNGWGNSELEYYTGRPENVIVQGGVLKINAIKESYSGKAYTSTRMLSINKFAFTYGKVVVRAKLAAGVGTWPAIWMLGSNISAAGWPACGEIDIVEHRGSELNKIFGTLHYPGRSGGNADGYTKVIADATTEFHVYKIDWSTSTVKIYVDDELFHTVINSASIPFNHDFFLLINLAMGGTFGGTVDPEFTNATMEVDYIRVYK